jgi:hypothetical protein
MKKIIIMSAMLTTLISQAQLVLQGKTFFSPRSQATNAARMLVDWAPFAARPHNHTAYGIFTLTTEYTRSWRPKRIAEALFGTNVLSISGSQVVGRGDQDILADYFGLSPEFASTVNLNPLIQNALLIGTFYCGLDSWYPGLYFYLQAPLVWTFWNLRLTEFVIDPGTQTEFPARYMDTQAIPAPFTSFIDALRGQVPFGQVKQPLAFGRVACGQSTFGLAELLLVFGWNFYLHERGAASLNVRTSVPTGTRPNGIYLFEPFVGNGKHWEFGLGFSGRALLWEEDGEQELTLYLDMNLMHLFKARQRRSFDFCNNFGSRYILLKEFDEQGNYIGQLTPAINKTTLACDVQIDIEFDFVLMFGYVNKGLQLDVGYNGWIRSKEKIFLRECFPAKRFAFKGIQNVVTPTGTVDNSTQSSATLFGNNFADQAAIADSPSPVFIQPYSIDPRSGGVSRQTTHKIFAHAGYAWLEHTAKPSIGIGTELEFEGVNESAIVQPEVRPALSLWGIWLKAGLMFG